MLGASLALFADLGACHVQKSSVTICVLPTPFRWGATRFKMLGDHAPIIISIHALRVEGDQIEYTRKKAKTDFYPRPPGGGRPDTFLTVRKITEFLSTPSGWRATVRDYDYDHDRLYFYPRPPGGGRRRTYHVQRFIQINFYPRPPGGGRQHGCMRFKDLQAKISIHALRVEGDSGYNPWRWGWDISIHALRVEGDTL